MYDNIRTKLVTLLYGKQTVLYLSRKTNADCMNMISGFLEKGVSLPIRVLNSITHSYKDISKEPKIFRIKLEKILNEFDLYEETEPKKRIFIKITLCIKLYRYMNIYNVFFLNQENDPTLQLTKMVLQKIDIISDDIQRHIKHIESSIHPYDTRLNHGKTQMLATMISLKVTLLRELRECKNRLTYVIYSRIGNSWI